MIILFMGAILLIILAIILHDPVVRVIVIANYHLLTWIDAVVDAPVVSDSIAALKTVRNVKELTWGDSWALTSLTGDYIKWLVIPPMAWLGWWLISADPIERRKSVKNMQALVEDKAEAFPTIRPVVGMNLLDKKHYVDDWRPQDNPFEFCVRHHLLKRRTKERDKDVSVDLDLRELRKLDSTQYNNKSNYLDEPAAIKSFEAHLGECINPSGEPPSTPEEALSMVMGLPPHYRALSAVMLARYVGGRAWRERSHALLEQYANSYYVRPNRNFEVRVKILNKKLKGFGLGFLARHIASSMFWLRPKPSFKLENLNMRGVDDAIRELMLDKSKTLRVMQPFRKRAWSHTFMIDLMERAREYGGILITADFIWLKPVDRQLFYVLNSAGRKTPQIEAAGAFAQYFAEDVFGRPFPTPEVEMAVVALKKFLVKEGWTPDPMEQRPGDASDGGPKPSRRMNRVQS